MKTALQLSSKCIVLIVAMFCTLNLNATTSIGELFNGPNITGKYEFDRFGLTGAYVITKTAEGIHIEKYDNGETYEKSARAGSFPDYIVGDYNWESTRGAFMQTTRSMSPTQSSKFLIYKVRDGLLAVRNDSGEVGTFKKIQGSLGDLVGSQRADVSHLIGNWNLDGLSSTLRFTNGVDHDLQVRYGSNVYQLDKGSSSVFETYSGQSRSGGESISFKVMSPGRIKLNVAGTDIMATKSGGASTSVTTGSRTSSVGATMSNTSSSGGSYTNTSTSGNAAADKLMFTALREVDEDALKETFQAGANVNAKNVSGRTALHEAVLSGDTYILDAVLNQNPNINLKDGQGRTPLEIAITKSTSSDISMVNSLLDLRPSISTNDIDKVLSKNNGELLTAIMNAGADKNYIATTAINRGDTVLFNDLLDKHGVSPTPALFDKVLALNKIALAEKMLDKGLSSTHAMDASIKANKIDFVYAAMEKGGSATNALKYAARVKDTDLAKRAVEDYGADAEVGLNEAVIEKNVAVASVMLENNANPNTQIFNVARSGDLEMLDLFLSKNADPDKGLLEAAKAGKYKATALMLEYDAKPGPLLTWAVTENKTYYVKQAIDSGADATIPSYIGKAAGNGNLDIVTALLGAGASPDDGMLAATKANKLTIVQKLVQAGADASSDELLQFSAQHNNPLLTNIFIQGGANPQVGVIAAVKNSAAKTMALLFTNGATAEDQALILTAVKNDCTACAKILIDQGLKAEYQDASTGKYLMHYAAEKSNASMIELLYDYGAEIDPLASGSTPLHLAVKNRRKVAAVEMLLKSGADVNALNGKGKTPRKIATGSKIKKVLKDAGGLNRIKD